MSKQYDGADSALPNDDTIVDFVKSCGHLPSPRDIARAFNIDRKLRPALRRRLRYLVEKGKFPNNPKHQVTSSTQLPEISVLELLNFDDNGDGIARPVDEINGPLPEIRVILSRREGRAPAIGNQILARLVQIAPSIYEARIIRLLDRQEKRVFGIAVATGKGFMLQPATRGKRDRMVLIIPAGSNVEDGDLVETALQTGRSSYSRSTKLITNLGNITHPGAFSALALAEFNIRHVFPDSVLLEASKLKKPTLEGRRDLCDTAFVTIDGADARDYDDAVYAEPATHGGWRLLVAIADVSHYVQPECALDREAQLRGNSVYLPDRVVPMLPEAISNDLCSLRPLEDRAAMVAEIYIDKDGQRQQFNIERAMIRSHARLTYDKVQAVYDGVLDESDCEVPHGTLHALFGAWRALAIDRNKRAPLALDLKERRVVLGDDSAPLRIEQSAQNEAQRLIEDFMIAANVAAADHLIAKQKPCVFRVHDTPDPKKAVALVKLAEEVGARFTVGQVLRPHHFNQILAAAAGTAVAGTINETVLRSQAKAIYSVDNIGHFGLSLRNYAHFTSPIRRYSDLLVHRAIVDTIIDDNPKKSLEDMPFDKLSEICKHISETEANATSAERRTIDRFAAALFESRLGEVVEGVVVAVTNFGAFVRIDDGAADGLMPMKTLPDDYYDFNESTKSLTGRHTGWTFTPGNDVKVRIRAVTAISGGILLDWVEGGVIAKGLSNMRFRANDSLAASITRKKNAPARKSKAKKR